MINQEDYIALGELYKEHGIKAECKFYSYSGSDRNLKEENNYSLENIAGEILEVKIEKIYSHDKYYIIKFDCFTQPEEILPWRKSKLWIRKNLLSRDNDVPYDFEYVGCMIVDQRNCETGKIKRVEYMPLKQFVIDVEGQEKLIPVVNEFIIKQDIENKVIVMELPEGLLDT